MDDELRASGSSTASNTTSTAGTTTVDSADVVCGCPELGPETIEVEQVLAIEMRQKVVELDMFVPDPKPDIRQVIDVYVKDVCIKSVDIIPNKVIIRGDLEIKVMYVADLPDEPVHAFERKHIRFTRDIDVDGADPDMKATADVQVEYVDYDFHCHHDDRKVHVTIVLKFWTRVLTTTDLDVYALSPIDEVGAFENTTASTSSDDMAAASNFDDETVSATQTAEGDVFASSPENVLVSGPLTSTAGVSQSINGTAGTVTGNSVNVRTGPGTNYPSVAKVNAGTAVTIREQAFGWYSLVLADGTTGWIASWLVSTNGTTGAKG